MKVIIKEIPKNQEPYASLHIAEETKDIKRLVEYIKTEQYHGVRLPCYEGETLCYVDSRNIFYIESINEILYLHTAKEIFTSKKRLYELKELLPKEFIHASKSAIMNIRQVRKYSPLDNGLMLGEFSNGDAVYISRRCARELRWHLKEGKFYE